MFPAHGNLVLIRLPSDARAHELRDRLHAAGIRVKDVSGVPLLGGCLRISVGLEAEKDAGVAHGNGGSEHRVREPAVRSPRCCQGVLNERMRNPTARCHR